MNSVSSAASNKILGGRGDRIRSQGGIVLDQRRFLADQDNAVPMCPRPVTPTLSFPSAPSGHTNASLHTTRGAGRGPTPQSSRHRRRRGPTRPAHAGGWPQPLSPCRSHPEPLPRLNPSIKECSPSLFSPGRGGHWSVVRNLQQRVFYWKMDIPV